MQGDHGCAGFYSGDRDHDRLPDLDRDNPTESPKMAWLEAVWARGARYGRRRVGVDLIGRVDAKQTADERKRSSARPEADILRAAQIAETRARLRGRSGAHCLCKRRPRTPADRFLRRACDPRAK